VNLPPGRGATLAAPDHGASAPSARPWQRILAEAETDLDRLWQRLDLPGAPTVTDRAAVAEFPLVVPEPFLGRMRRGDLGDPLLQQVLARGVELEAVAGFGPDPVAESACHAAPGLLRKYHGRALLVTTGSCAVHCRYCFRRHFPYQSDDRRGAWWRAARAQFAADPQLVELILSGGDPLILPDALLDRLIDDFRRISHLRRLRIHTRLPVVIPQRVTAALCRALARWPTPPVVVIHANHPQEIDAAVLAACGELRRAGAILLNQAVLLAGVNDRVEPLAELSQRLHEGGIQPYYLHQLDRVAGAAHFAVSDARARALRDRLQALLPGYLVPRLVREIPDRESKTPLPEGDASDV